jgi:hypothetical protein
MVSLKLLSACRAARFGGNFACASLYERLFLDLHQPFFAKHA